jgi:hypothetical protein
MFNEATSSFQKLWNFEVAGHLEWNHPAIGPDGSIYVGSSVGGQVNPFLVYQPGAVPANTTCTFYAIKGPTNPVAVEDSPSLPDDFYLAQNYPNPFPQSGSAFADNPETTIRFELRQPTEISLAIFNTVGQQVRLLVSPQRFETGGHQLLWDGRGQSGNGLPSGVYFLRLTNGMGLSRSRKLVLIR